MTTRLPLALTWFGLVMGVAFLPLVWWGAPTALLVVLLCSGLLSDSADGILARRLGVATLALRRLDTRADMVFYGCAAVAALVRATFPLGRLWPWLIAYGVLFASRNLVDYLRYRASPSYHMWSGKLWSVVLFVHLGCFFCGEQALPLLPLAFALYAINTVEGIVASLVLDRPNKDVPSLRHAFALQRRHGPNRSKIPAVFLRVFGSRCLTSPTLAAELGFNGRHQDAFGFTSEAAYRKG